VCGRHDHPFFDPAGKSVRHDLAGAGTEGFYRQQATLTIFQVSGAGASGPGGCGDKPSGNDFSPAAGLNKGRPRR